jgi:hypothetical protein
LRAAPTERHLAQLAAAILDADLAVSHASVLPAILARSPFYAPLVAERPLITESLEVVGPHRVPSSFQGIRDVEVRILRLEFTHDPLSASRTTLIRAAVSRSNLALGAQW